MKKPKKSEIVIAVVIMLVWFYAMLVFTHYDVQRAGSLSVGAVVGMIFAIFGYSAEKSWKNTGVIVFVAFLATMVYNMVVGLIHYFY